MVIGYIFKTIQSYKSIRPPADWLREETERRGLNFCEAIEGNFIL